MTKSIPIILGMGAAACLALSMTMQRLVDHRASGSESPFAPVIANRLGSQLVGAVRVREIRDGAWLRMLVIATVTTGLDRKLIAVVAGRELWLAALRAGVRPDEVEVELRDADGGEPVRVRVPAPGPRADAPPAAVPPRAR